MALNTFERNYLTPLHFKGLMMLYLSLYSHMHPGVVRAHVVVVVLAPCSPAILPKTFLSIVIS